MADRNGAVFLLRYLYEHTDMDHPVSSVRLREIMQENGYTSDPRTIRKEADMLAEAGFDILISGQPGVSTQYCYGARTWDRTELMILIDAVSSAQFITPGKTDQLIEKLSVLAGQQHRENLTPEICVSEHVKARNDMILYILEKIGQAIREKRKIAFKIYNYGPDKRQTERHGGEIYVLSPYNTVWHDDRYYAVGYSDKRKAVVAFRIDRMGLPEVLEEEAVPPPKSYNVQDYADIVTKMYGGARQQVRLRCHVSLADSIIDRFGKDVRIYNVTEDTFDVSAEVAVSGTFLAWVFQYTGQMILLSPRPVRELYAAMLRTAMGDTAAGEQGRVSEKSWKL